MCLLFFGVPLLIGSNRMFQRRPRSLRHTHRWLASFFRCLPGGLQKTGAPKRRTKGRPGVRLRGWYTLVKSSHWRRECDVPVRKEEKNGGRKTNPDIPETRCFVKDAVLLGPALQTVNCWQPPEQLQVQSGSFRAAVDQKTGTGMSAKSDFAGLPSDPPLKV